MITLVDFTAYGATDAYEANDTTPVLDPETAAFRQNGDLHDSQVSSEAEEVSLQLVTPDATGAVTFSATGLPPGLSIDEETGLITGRPYYYTADTDDGMYEVTVETEAGDDTDSATFIWYIQDTNRIARNDDLVSRVDQTVFFVACASDVFFNDLTWSASGLPEGLTLDSETGVISGTLDAHDPGITQYETTLTVTDGTASDSRTFTWNVLAGDDPIVLFAINNTMRHGDDLALLDPATPLTVRLIL